jgi:hypothetical protein
MHNFPCRVDSLNWCDVAQLPDVALLRVFDFCVDNPRIYTWYTLVHVCRKWRSIVFGSPRRLDLRLHCNTSTPVRETLDVWPPLPIVISSVGHNRRGVDNIIAALEHNDRICQVDLFYYPSSHFEKVLAVMQRPFPALTSLWLRLKDETAPVDSERFLGGSAPRLETLFLYHIPFPGLPKLLLSATHLAHLTLWKIPHSGYFSPDAIATCLFVLTRLECLDIAFESPQSRPELTRRRPPPHTRAVLPVLTKFQFKGVDKYLEDLVVWIDVPLLHNLAIDFFHQLIFDTSQLSQFISRTPKLKTHNKARVVFSKGVSVTLPQRPYGRLYLGISCRQRDWQLSSLVQVCSLSIPRALISTVEQLYISESLQLPWQDDSQWLELLHPFTAVKDLYISQEFVPRILPALQELTGEKVTEVLPALQTLFLDEPLASGPVQDIIVQFVDARRRADHPISVSRWEKE